MVVILFFVVWCVLIWTFHLTNRPIRITNLCSSLLGFVHTNWNFRPITSYHIFRVFGLFCSFQPYIYYCSEYHVLMTDIQFPIRISLVIRVERNNVPNAISSDNNVFLEKNIFYLKLFYFKSFFIVWLCTHCFLVMSWVSTDLNFYESDIVDSINKPTILLLYFILKMLRY